tara:strand:+ start:5907 stop:6383 length:477 start_codon:yes stop_codon:yes gene_type:complete
MNQPRRRELVSTIALIFLSGCSGQTQTIESFRRISNQTAKPAATDSEPSRVTAPDQAFDANFPDRIDPFTFPSDVESDKPSGDHSIKSAAQVDLIGFADVGEPRVFLRARGKTHSLTVGDTVYGVEVTEIRPPAVRMRMGSLAWTATMFDPVASTPSR